MEVLKIQSDQHGVLDLTSMVKDIVEKSSVSEGLCCVFVPHTTAGLVIYSGIDPKGLLDLNDTVKTMVPVRTDFHHQCDPPSDAAGHIKSALFGNSITFIVHENELVLGGSQYLYFYGKKLPPLFVSYRIPLF